ncbi:MAG: hypothetical protein QXZ13_03745 [Candidatus Diapherotrites archaeon]
MKLLPKKSNTPKTKNSFPQHTTNSSQVGRQLVFPNQPTSLTNVQIKSGVVPSGFLPNPLNKRKKPKA